MKKTKRSIISVLLCIALLLGVVAEIPITVVSAAENIPAEAFEYNGHHYMVYSGVCDTWEEAKEYCAGLGGYLSTISTAEENQAVFSYITSLGYESVYFGYTDSFREGVWRWANNENATFENWAAGEPNNLNGNSNNEDYAEFYYQYTDGTWNDGDFGRETESDEKNFLCEWGKYPKANWYDIFVVNSNGDPIKDANVTYSSLSGSQNSKTDKNGAVRFNEFSIGDPEIRISASGYLDYSTADSDYAKSPDGYETVVLYTPAEGKYKLSRAILSKTDFFPETNLVNLKKRISLTNSNITTFTISCNKFFVPVTYQLLQGSKLISTSSTGTFNLSRSDFSVGKDIKVKVTDAQNNSSVTKLNLEFTNDVAVKNSSLKIGNKFSIAIGDDVPYVGNSTIDLDIPDLPIEVYVEDGKIHVGVNLKLYDSNGIKSFKEQKDDINKLISDMKAASGIGLNKKTKENVQKFLKQRNKFKVPMMGSVDVAFLGYGEAAWDGNGIQDISLELILTMNAKLNKNWNFVAWVVPVTIQLTVGAKVTADIKFDYNFNSSSLNGDFKLKIGPYLNAFGGVGIDKYIGVGAYGDATGDIEIQLIGTTNPTGLNYIDLTGELGIKAYAGPFSWKKSFAHNTWHLYSRKNYKGSAMVGHDGTSDSMYNIDNYEIDDLSYLDGESKWMGGYSSKSADLVGANEDGVGAVKTLLASTYRNAKPTMTAFGNTALMAFVSADNTVNPFNATSVKFSVYDKSSDTWSAPAEADGSCGAEYDPVLYSDENGTWLAYIRLAREFDEETDYADYCAAYEIAVSKYNEESRSFETPTVVSEANAYNRMPVLAMMNGSLTAAWISSANGSYFTADNYRVCYSRLENNTWSQASCAVTETSPVRNLYADENDHTFVYTLDSDNDLETTDDICLMAADFNDNRTQIAIGNISNITPLGNRHAILFINNGALYQFDGSQAEEVSESFGFSPQSVGESENGVYFSASAEDKKSAVYYMEYDQDNHLWLQPVMVYKADNYIENIDVVSVNHTELLSMLNKSVDISEDNVVDDCNLSYMIVPEKTSLAISDVSYDESSLKGGEPFAISVEVLNDGNQTSEQYDITVKNPVGEVICSKTVSSALLPGNAEESVLSVEMPQVLVSGDYVISVSKNGTICDEKTIGLGNIDLALTLEEVVIGRKHAVNCIVKNKSDIDGYYYLENPEEPLSDPTYTAIQANETQITTFDVDPESFSGMEQILNYRVVSQKPDYNLMNNENAIFIELTDLDYLQSKHPYVNNCNIEKTFHKDGAHHIKLTFSVETFVEKNYDFIQLYDVNHTLIGKYTGNELAGKTIPVLGDTVTIKLTSDYVHTYYGYSLTSIETADSCDHPSTVIKNYSEATCKAAGFSGDIYCAECGAFLEAGHSLDVVDHDYVNGRCRFCGEYNQDSATVLKCNHSVRANVNSNSQEAEILFVPPVNGTVTFYSEGYLDTIASLYNSSGSLLQTNDNSGTNYNFMMTANVTANQQYVLKCRTVSNIAGSFDVYADFTETAPKYTYGDADLNNELSIADATLLQMAAAQYTTLSALQNYVGDIDRNGITDILDVTAVQKILVDYPVENSKVIVRHHYLNTGGQEVSVESTELLGEPGQRFNTDPVKNLHYSLNKQKSSTITKGRFKYNSTIVVDYYYEPSDTMVTVHAKHRTSVSWNPYIWVWDTVSYNTVSTWPGNAMRAGVDQWYTYSFDCSKSETYNLIISNQGNPQTLDYNSFAAHDVWVMIEDYQYNGYLVITCYAENPDVNPNAEILSYEIQMK